MERKEMKNMKKSEASPRIMFGIITLIILLLAIDVNAITNVSQCTTISSSGEYVLNKSIIDSNADECIRITSSDVIFNGDGHIVDGIGEFGTGIYVHNSTKNLKNFTVKNVVVTDWNFGISLENTSNGMVINNTARSNYYYGINHDISFGNNLSNNTVYDSLACGISVSNSNNNTLINNKAYLNEYCGIELGYSRNNTLSRNTVYNHFSNGIDLFSSSDNILTDNIVKNNDVAGINLVFSTNNRLSGNNVSDNLAYGIDLFSSSNNILTDNFINNNYDGISLESLEESSTNNRLSGNIISNNYNGINMAWQGKQYNNKIYNNYLKNINNALDNGENIWNITKTLGKNIIGGPYIGGNYWSDYIGNDTDGDGLGDTLLPYNSSGNIINGGDYLPLTKVYTRTAGIISGYKINDTNGNGKLDIGEKGISNWTIKLIGITCKGKDPRIILRKETLTDALGFYKFDNLSVGRYIIAEKMKKGFVPTSTPVKNIKLKQNENSINNNFTNRPVKNIKYERNIDDSIEEFIEIGTIKNCI